MWGAGLTTGTAASGAPSTSSSRRRTRRRIAGGVLAAALTAVVLLVMTAGAQPLPVPDAVVVVTTKSGDVTKEHLVPIGGVPVPIDVDEPGLTGVLEPDIDVSVGLVAFDELPGKPIVPNVVIRRNALAVSLDRPAPPLEIDAKIVLRDANDGLKKLVEVHYGYATPPGARIPPVVTAKLLGPIQGGFVDPLIAKVESPGYSGPLDLKISATTDDLDASFKLAYDALPESIFVNEDPRENGLDALYRHAAPVADVHLDADATLIDRRTNERLDIGANIERLPQQIALSNTNTEDQTLVTYDSSSALNKPDVHARYRDFEGDGDVITDADIKVAGLPFRMCGKVDTVKDPTATTGPKRTVDRAHFEVLNGTEQCDDAGNAQGTGEEVDSVDFLVRNFVGPAGNVPAPQLGPDQFVAVGSRRQADGSTRFRAAGRVLGVRSATVERQGDDNRTIDARTDLGDGIRPLRAIVDLDDRGPGAPDEAQRMKVDALVTPLPARIHVNFDPSGGGTDPTKLLYEASSRLDADVDALIADGAADGCGQAQVTCAEVRIDKIPGTLSASLPGTDGTDFSISHNGGTAQHPDVRATVDDTSLDEQTNTTSRTWADVRLLRVPNEVTGRLDTSDDGVLRAAEFHGCKFDFGDGECDDAQGAIGRVRFTVRDQPSRTGLPPRPDTEPQFVTLLSRHKAPGPKRFEVVGQVDEVRNVVFHQRDTVAGDKKADGVLGVEVDVGSATKFDAIVDDIDDALDESKTPPAVIGDAITNVKVQVEKLPHTFTACIRESEEKVAPPDPATLPDDPLLEPCQALSFTKPRSGQQEDVVKPDAGEQTVTPLSAHYTAVDADGKPEPTKVTAKVRSTEPDLEDKTPQGNPIVATEKLDLVIDPVPASLRVDVIPPITPDAAKAIAGRRLKLAYNASSTIPLIDFELESRRASDICEDPRPGRKALCVGGRLTGLPAGVKAIFDPDESKGDIDVLTDEPRESNNASCANGADDDGDGADDGADPDCKRLSITPLHLSKVSPEAGSSPLVLDATIEGITRHLVGKIQEFELDGEAPGVDPPRKLADQLATCSNKSSGVPIDDDGDGLANALDDDCDKDPARLSFNACARAPENPGPGNDPNCQGIEKITFTATNALIGDPVPPVPPASPAISGDQEFAFIKVGDDFRANGLVRRLKELAYSKLNDAGQASVVTTLSSAFGSGSPLRAYVRLDSAAEDMLVDGVINEAPERVDVCLRDKADPADLTGTRFCEALNPDGDTDPTKQPPNNQRTDEGKLALQALVTADSQVEPDIELRRLELSKGGGAEVISAYADIKNLGQRIDVLAATEPEADIKVEGHDRGDGPGATPKNVADRVTFRFQNFLGPEGTGFPWEPLDAGFFGPGDPRNPVDPEADTARNQGNYLRLVKERDGRVFAKGSVPDIRQVAVEPRPCNQGDARFPDPATPGFAPNQRPKYTCVRAVVAPGSPLGVAVRTRDDKDEILAVDEGLVTSMPTSLQVTLGKSPDDVKLAPVCADDQSPAGTDVIPCRPPMLSVVAPSSSPGVLQGRLAIGDVELNRGLRTREPDDTLSRRLAFEDPPKLSSFPNGARVKVGTQETPKKLAIRAGLKVQIPKFLDLDPPTLYDCKHATETPGSACNATGVGKEFNTGFESKDILFKLVAADDKPGGTPAASRKFLGRVALLVEPMDANTDKGQIVLTGMPDPDDKDPLVKRSTLGASSNYNESLPPPTDPSTNGFLAPGHLDARVYLRSDFRAVKDGKNQNSYAQIDGRVNAPLSLTARLNERMPNDEQKAKKYVEPLNRANQRVSPTQLTVRNAPGLGGSVTDYVKPTFRVRAEVRDTFQEDKDLNIIEKVFFCSGDGLGIQIPALFTFCAILPTKAEARYLDIQANADPKSDGQTTTSSAARTIDAVAGPFGKENAVDLRAFDTVTDTPIGGTPLGKGGAGRFTPLAAVRLTNFNLGLKVGAGFLGIIGGSLTWEMVGDLVLGVAGHANSRTRLSSNLATMRAKGEGGVDPDDYSRVITDLMAKMRLVITAEAFFGLVQKDVFNKDIVDTFKQPIQFNECSAGGLLLPFLFTTRDEFWTGPTNADIAQAGPGDRQATIRFPVLPSSFAQAANTLNAVLTNALYPLWCAFGTSTSELVNSTSPAPGYTNNDSLVPGQTGTSNTNGTATPPDASPDAPDFTVPAGTTSVRCGFYSFDELTVNGDLRAGVEGTTDPNGRTCDGSLDIVARKVTVGTDGDISAGDPTGGLPATRTTAGAGHPGGVGGGAGHHGQGGDSGREKATANTGEGGSSYPAPADGPIKDFGSRGADGDEDGGGIQPDATIPGGRGAGTIRITAADRVILNGNAQISANGGTGASAATRNTGGTACKTGGGGGSGGAIEITANIVDGDGTIEVKGGNGGASGYTGGGGSGGRVTINAVADDIPSSKVLRSGGKAGTVNGTGDCHTGTPDIPFRTGDDGAAGTELSGTDPDMVSNVSLNAANPNPITKGDASGNVKLDVVGIDGAGGPLEIVLCRRSVAWTNSGGFADPGLDPVGHDTLANLTQNATCSTAARFSSPTSGFEYEDTAQLNLPSSIYGFFAYARRPICVSGAYSASVGLCVSGGSFSTPFYDNQDNLPPIAQAKLGVDKDVPSLTATPTVGEPGCPAFSFSFGAITITGPGSRCLSVLTGGIDVDAKDSESGVKSVECRVTTAVSLGSYNDCKARPSPIPLSREGANIVSVRVTDTAGNVKEQFAAVSFFADMRDPNKPSVSLDFGTDPVVNGWHKVEPAVSVSASDDNPSSGFKTNAIKLSVDGATVECGADKDGSAATTGSVGVSCSPVDPAKIPSDGIHTFTAKVIDRVGRESADADEKVMKVDREPPTSRMVLGPKTPDGSNGWYVTKPFFAIGATDQAGGSGVDPSLDVDKIGVGIFVSVDGKPFDRFDPTKPNELDDGVHSVCWFARDVAGNREDADAGAPGDQAHCKSNIKVDTTAPTVDHPITPATPNGDNSFYISTPTTDGTASDPQASGVNQVSGVDRIQQNLDDAGWRAAAPTPIAEGEHVMLTRSFDRAGNQSPTLERIIRVDRSDPSATLKSYPPAPNAQGWFRRHLVDSVAAHDGRDGSGADGAQFTIDADGPSSYLGPFGVTDGVRTVTIRARDFAGRQGADVTRTQRVDTVAPFGAPVGRTPTLVLPAAGLPNPVPLRYHASDALTPCVKVQVSVYNNLGGHVRRLDAPGAAPCTGGHRPAGNSEVGWNGRDSSDRGVLPGLYHYRVRVIDQAGNTVLSDESPTFAVVLGLLPP